MSRLSVPRPRSMVGISRGEVIVPSICTWRLAMGLLAFAASGDIAPLRFEFETDESGKAPTDWILTTPGYQAVVTQDQPHLGKQCVRIRISGDGPKDRVAVLLRSVDATPYRGRRIRLRGSVRIEPSGQADRVQLWLRVDRDANKPGFFDNMNDRPIRRRDWSEAWIDGEVAPDARTIVYGLLLFGGGPAWLDDVSLESTGEAPVVPKEAARPLVGRGLENLVAFTRLLGYVRHFHPSDEATAADWDAFAVAGVRTAESAFDARDLASRLEILFRPLGPTIRVFPTGVETKLPP